MSRVDRRRAALRELVLVAALYVAYDISRALVRNDLIDAVARANGIVRLERFLHLSWEGALNQVFVDHDWIGVLADYWYSTAHYVLTIGVLVWLYRRGRHVYVRARRALAVATISALALFQVAPTAPPRMVAGYVDVLSLHAADGWWGSDASAPRGLGGLTNQLAAFPSLHAGWSLWVAIALSSATSHRVVRALGWAYAAITALVVVGTANHWVIDVLAGWAVVGAAWLVTGRTAWLVVARFRHRLVGAVPAHVESSDQPAHDAAARSYD